MAAMLDLIGSIVIGGLVMLLMVSFGTNLSATTDAQVFNQGVQENVRSLTDVLEFDLRKLGYNVPLDNMFRNLNDSTISFYGDIDNSGGYDSVQYYFRTISPKHAHNPSVGTLYRAVNMRPPQAIQLGVTRFKVDWFDKDGKSRPTQLQDVRTLSVALTVESDSPYDSVKTGGSWKRLYSGVTWERSIRPKNLR